MEWLGELFRKCRQSIEAFSLAVSEDVELKIKFKIIYFLLKFLVFKAVKLNREYFQTFVDVIQIKIIIFFLFIN